MQPDHVGDTSEMSYVPPRVDVLREAEKLITGDRNVTYGPPTQNFTDIAEMWTIQLRHKLKPDEVVTDADMAWMLILMKACRAKTQPKRDNWADTVGYAGCGYECDVTNGRI